jgi:hypothetical protein
MPFDTQLHGSALEMLREMLAMIRDARHAGTNMVPLIMRLTLPESRTLAIVRDLEGPQAEERVAARLARQEINCVFRLEDVESVWEVLCRHLTPEIGQALKQNLPADGCWFLDFFDGRVSLSAASTERPVAAYVPRQYFALAAS